MPEALRVRVQSLTGLPQGRCPPLEQLMRLLPVGALPHMHLVTDVPAAPDLWRTHPLPIQTARKPLAIEEGASSLSADAPDARMDVIAGSSM